MIVFDDPSVMSRRLQVLSYPKMPDLGSSFSRVAASSPTPAMATLITGRRVDSWTGLTWILKVGNRHFYSH